MKRRSSGLVTIILVALLGACIPPPTTTPLPPGLVSPSISPEPTCYLQPQPTGEKIIPITLGTPPPPRVSTGELVKFNFSGGYLIPNNARVCGEDNIIGYIYADELPNFRYDRQVTVSLDNQSLAQLNCGYDCQVEVRIPESFHKGTVRLWVGPPYGFDELEFQLEIIDSDTP